MNIQHFSWFLHINYCLYRVKKYRELTKETLANMAIDCFICSCRCERSDRLCVCVCVFAVKYVKTSWQSFYCTFVQERSRQRRDGPGEVYSCRPGIRHTAALEEGRGHLKGQRSLLSSEVHDAVLQRSDTVCVCVCVWCSQLIMITTDFIRMWSIDRERERVRMKEGWTSCSLMLIFQDRAARLNKTKPKSQYGFV